MKKLISVLIAVIVCLGCVIPAFADIDGPTTKDYDAIVVNPDGVKTSHYYNPDSGNWEDVETVVPQNSVVSVTGDYEYKDGKKILTFRYGNYQGFASSDDLKMKDETVGKSAAVKLDESIDLVAINKSGAALRKGPSEAYDEIAKIPYGTEFHCEYSDSAPGYTWFFVTYSGTEGWIYGYQYGYSQDFAIKGTPYGFDSGKIMVVADDVKLAERPAMENEDLSSLKYLSGAIPAGTMFTFDTYYEDLHGSFWALVTYNGTTGWIYYVNGYEPGMSDNMAKDCKDTIISADKNGLKLYSLPFDKGNSLGVSLNSNVRTQADMKVRDYTEKIDKTSDDYYDNAYETMSYRVTVDGKTGWVTDKLHEVSTTNITSATPMYSAPDKSSSVIATISAGAIVSKTDMVVLGEKGYDYVTYGGKTGWIESASNDQMSVYEESNTLVTAKKTKLYTSPEGIVPIATIPESTTLESDYSSYDFGTEKYSYHVSYNGSEGWIKDNYIISNNDSVSVKAAVSNLDSESAQLSADDIQNSTDSTVLLEYNSGDTHKYYVEADGKEGWIDADTYNEIIKNPEESIDTSETAEATEITEETSAEETEAAESSAKKVIICCAAAAVVLALAAIVTIIFIKKKKAAGQPDTDSETDKYEEENKE